MTTKGGFKCPHCNAPTTILHTRWGADRRRQCTGPEQHRFNTTEIVTPEKARRVYQRKAKTCDAPSV